MADQAVISGTSFLLMVAAARSLGPEAFGLFAFLRTVMFFAATFQGSLITTPHNVFGATRTGDEYRRYTSSTLLLQMMFIVAAGGLLLLALVVLRAVVNDLVPMMLAMIVATCAGQLHEFVRGVLFTEQRFGIALVIDSIVSALRLVLVVALMETVGLSGESLFLIMAATWGLGAVLGGLLIRKSLGIEFDPRVVTEHWEFGRWLFASNAVRHIPQYTTAAVMTSVVSLGAYGAYRAIAEMMQGFSVPARAAVSVLRPYLARRAECGHRAVWQVIWPIMVLGGIVYSALALVLVLFRESVIGLIYGPEFVPYAAIVFLVLLTPIFSWQREMLTGAFQASRITRPIFAATLISTFAGVVGGSAALVMFGFPAAGASELIVAIVAALWLGWIWRRYVLGDGNRRKTDASAMIDGASTQPGNRS